MLIKQLKIQNFKGIKEKTIDFFPKTQIRGDNATGKTTIFDAWLWLLFEKDSSDSKQFQWKPVDENNIEINNLETSIEAIIENETEQIMLKRTISEKWTRPRGAKMPEFKGHESAFEVDHKPVKKKEFESFIADMFGDADKFKLLSNVLYFNEQINWTKRREMLIELAGNVTDEQVCEQHDYNELVHAAGKHSIDSFREVLNYERKKLNEKLVMIPARIDEANKALPELVDFDESELVTLNKKAETIREKIEAAKNGNGAIDIKAKIRENEEQLNVLESNRNKKIRELEQKHQKEIDEADKFTNDALRILRKLESERDHILDTRKMVDMKKEQLESELNKLRQQYHDIQKEQFSGAEICPTCKQTLPETTIESAKELFNVEKSKKLENNIKTGKKTKEQLESLKYTDTKELDEKIKDASEFYDKCKTKLETIMKSWTAPNIPYPPEKDLINGNIAILKTKLQAIESGVESDVSEYKAELSVVQNKINELNGFASVKKEHERISKRIAELDKEEKQLVKDIEEIEQLLNQAEDFTRTKVSIIENKVAEMFKYCRFKLFENQINGGLKEVCECTVKGVPYNALNNAGKINAGIDIINTFSSHYGLICPVFIDNAESVVELNKTIGQAIYLIVDGNEKELKIEGMQ